MQKVVSCSLLLFMFHFCEAQKLEIKYYPSFHLNGRYIVMCNDKLCTLQFDVIDRKDSSKILISETRTVPDKQIDEVKRLLETARVLSSYHGSCLDGMQVNGMFKNDTLRNEFVFDCLPNKKGIVQYDFLRQTNKTMLKVLKDRKSKRYVKIIKEYL